KRCEPGLAGRCQLGRGDGRSVCPGEPGAKPGGMAEKERVQQLGRTGVGRRGRTFFASRRVASGRRAADHDFSVMSTALQTPDIRVAALPQAIQRAAAQLLSQQDRRGFWWADLTADSTLESDYILLQLWMHPPRG